jgi:competence protein ComEA
MITFLLLSALVFADDKPQLPDAPGRAVTIKVCNGCHGAELMLGKPHSEDGWSAIVADMVQRGAQGTDEEFDEVVQYLTKNIKAGQVAKIDVNKAPAKTLEVGLGLTPKEVQALIAAREKAPFKSMDDLKKVSGIDAAKLEAKQKILAFQ